MTGKSGDTYLVPTGLHRCVGWPRTSAANENPHTAEIVSATPIRTRAARVAPKGGSTAPITQVRLAMMPDTSTSPPDYRQVSSSALAEGLAVNLSLGATTTLSMPGSRFSCRVIHDARAARTRT